MLQLLPWLIELPSTGPLCQGRSWMTSACLQLSLKVGIAASLYRCSTSTKSISTKKKKKKPVSANLLSLQDHGASLVWGYLVPCFVLCDLLSFQDEVSWEFLWLFYCRRTFLPEGLESRNWGAYQSVDDLEGAGGSPAMGLVTARNTYCRALCFPRNYHTAVSFLSNDLRDRIRQILGLPSLVVTVLCCGSCANRFNCFVGATRLTSSRK
jgi:hypothetical protein